LIVWIYVNAGRSVFAAIVFHAMSNVSEFLFPNYGSHYDPFYAAIVLGTVAAAVTFLWGPRTLAHIRYASAP
ncbi:MAG: CPBP family intramembrane metalloprotease, partial [Alphaproteobacteria bacterium]|nr:CPBP family intramembrane metalloprotease [Alphaproteobacteria bacterium]